MSPRRWKRRSNRCAKGSGGKPSERFDGKFLGRWENSSRRPVFFVFRFESTSREQGLSSTVEREVCSKYAKISPKARSLELFYTEGSLCGSDTSPCIALSEPWRVP